MRKIFPPFSRLAEVHRKQNESGGLTIDDTEAENFTTILAIAPSKVNEQVIWVGTDDGNLQVTKDGGESWSNVAPNLTGANSGSWIPYIEAGKTAIILKSKV